MRRKILFICGSMNQTTMLHKISMKMPEFDSYFTPYYGDGVIKKASEMGLLDFTVLGGKLKKQSLEYIIKNNLQLDNGGIKNDYDLVVTSSDLIIQKNIRNKKIILVQEGMTDPENFAYYLVKTFKLPRYIASTSTTGLSNAYDIFCVASEGYKELFIKKGVDPEKIIVTGIPNFDNCNDYLNNDFPHKNYVLVCTSDTRETFKYENRKKFIKRAVSIAQGRQLIFKLHPNEKYERAEKEIKKYAPEALVFSSGNTNHMIANCNTLITRFSTVVYVGLALGKEVYSEFNIDELTKLTPLQNGGKSAENIADICKILLESKQDIRTLLPTMNSTFRKEIAYN
ncbi:MAG TPA: hypothetical protein PLG90_02535 [Ignavibacteria bacterium]|nr:hypothetical protein [Ignavibacteria bacterium]